MKEINSLSHIVFALKYRRKEFYGTNRLEIDKILRELSKYNKGRILCRTCNIICFYGKQAYHLLWIVSS